MVQAQPLDITKIGTSLAGGLKFPGVTPLQTDEEQTAGEPEASFVSPAATDSRSVIEEQAQPVIGITSEEGRKVAEEDEVKLTDLEEQRHAKTHLNILGFRPMFLRGSLEPQYLP